MVFGLSIELLTAGLGAVEDDVTEDPSDDEDEDCSIDLSGMDEGGDSAQVGSLSKLKSTILFLF